MIKNTDQKYDKVVYVSEDRKKYTIDTNVIITGEEVQCPTDDTMSIIKNTDHVIIKKKCRFNPFK